MNLLRLLENGTHFPSVKNIMLTESANMTSRQLYERAIVKAYRAQRDLINETDAGNSSAKTAARQARTLLAMQGPMVLSPNLKAIKDLAIKQWNESFNETLKRILLDEGAAYDAAIEKAKSLLKTDSITRINHEDATNILDNARVKDRAFIRTATTHYHVVLYAYRGKEYVAVEMPARRTEVYKRTGE